MRDLVFQIGYSNNKLDHIELSNRQVFERTFDAYCACQPSEPKPTGVHGVEFRFHKENGAWYAIYAVCSEIDREIYRLAFELDMDINLPQQRDQLSVYLGDVLKSYESRYNDLLSPSVSALV